MVASKSVIKMFKPGLVTLKERNLRFLRIAFARTKAFCQQRIKHSKPSKLENFGHYSLSHSRSSWDYLVMSQRVLKRELCIKIPKFVDVINLKSLSIFFYTHIHK